MRESVTITSGPLAGCSVTSVTLSDVFTASELYVLTLNERDELGYLAAQQEWIDDHGDPLRQGEQWAATQLAYDGFLPKFAEWFPSSPPSSVDEGNPTDG